MEVNDIVRLVEAVSVSGLTEFKYEEGNVKIHMEKKQSKRVVSLETAAETQLLREDVVPQAEQDQPAKAKGAEILAPIVGVFYGAPSPEAEPFIKVGDRVEAGQVVGIVEAMKLMNEIESDVSGLVTEILVSDGDGVEYGQPLIRVEK